MHEQGLQGPAGTKGETRVTQRENIIEAIELIKQYGQPKPDNLHGELADYVWAISSIPEMVSRLIKELHGLERKLTIYEDELAKHTNKIHNQTKETT